MAGEYLDQVRRDKRAGFALIRTIENLVSSILRYASDFVQQTLEKAKETGSSAASKILVGMLSVALLGASGIAATAEQTGAGWIKQVIEIVQKQLENLQ